MGKTKKTKAKQATSVDYPSLVQSRKKTTSEHLRAANTNAAYERHVNCGRKWLSEAVLKWSTPPAASDSPSTNDRPPVEIEQLARGFDLVPNEFSPDALSLYITFKCVEEECKISTADQVRAAYKAMWDGA
jgi:hypothetical protein